MGRVTTSLWFDREAEPAAQLYTSLIPNSRITATTRHGEGAQQPAGTAWLVSFELDGVPYQALNGGPYFKLTEACSISVACETQAEIDRLWNALTADGGAESQCGWLRDPFGLSWQILPAQMDAWMRGPHAARVVAAFMPMHKLDLATLERAARGE
jgi:predicted 3-demethylubiquinone-9 3-methyltransferase (glyoxalase superfamily)